LTLLIFIMTMISGTCFAQQVNDKIDIIKLNVKLWRHPPYSKVSIEIIKQQITGEVFVFVNAVTYGNSIPTNNPKLNKSKIDTMFKIQKEVFVNLSNEAVPILNKINVLNKTDVPDNSVQVIVDGHQFTIEYGTYTESVAYNIWHPDYDTKQRGLTNFLNLCKKIIEIGGLNPKDIL
jgi:hypothetical protein